MKDRRVFTKNRPFDKKGIVKYLDLNAGPACNTSINKIKIEWISVSIL